MGPGTAIDVLVGFSRLVSEGDVPPSEVLELLADAVVERSVDAVVVVQTGASGAPELAIARGVTIGALAVDEMGEELERALLASWGRERGQALTLPIVSGGGLFGAVVLLWEDEDPDQRDVRLVEGLVDLAALALDRAVRTRSLEESLAQLKASREALARKEKLEALGKMAAVVAHEVKNPLASVSGALQVLSQRMQADSSEGRVVEMLLERLRDLGQMVDELLTFARPRSPVPSRLSVVDLLGRAADTLRANPQFPDVHLQVDVEPRDLSVLADASQLRGVLLNLLLNAAQAMEGRGTIRLHARPRGGWIDVRVIDDGPGVPADGRAHVFEPFFTTKTRGSGLGLAVAQQVVEAHGGRLSLESPDTGGATFVIRLPR